MYRQSGLQKNKKISYSQPDLNYKKETSINFQRSNSPYAQVNQCND